MSPPFMINPYIFGAGTPIAGLDIQEINYQFIGPGAEHDVAINSVDISKSIILRTGMSINANQSANLHEVGIFFDTSTNVKLIRGAGNSGNNPTLQFYVIQLPPTMVDSVTHGSIALPASTASATDTIPSTVLSRSTLIHNGQVCNTAVSNSSAFAMGLDYVDSTTVRTQRFGTGFAIILEAYYSSVQWASGFLNGSVQNIVIPSSGTTDTASATLSPSVTMAETFLINSGFHTDTVGTGTIASWPRSQLASASTVSWLRATSAAGVGTVYISVIPCQSSFINNIQRGIRTWVANNTQEVLSITAVDLSKTWAHTLGQQVGGNSEVTGLMYTDLNVSDLTFNRNTASGSILPETSWEVVELA